MYWSHPLHSSTKNAPWSSFQTTQNWARPQARYEPYFLIHPALSDDEIKTYGFILSLCIELINQCKFKKALLCDICSRPFLNNSSLKQHQSFHRPQRPFHCEDAGCAKSYKTRSELNRHMIVHSGEKKYGWWDIVIIFSFDSTFVRCARNVIYRNVYMPFSRFLKLSVKCGKTFLRKQYLKTHLVRHNEGLTWQCTLCAKIFVSEEDLCRHSVSYHKKGKQATLKMIKEPRKLAALTFPTLEFLDCDWNLMFIFRSTTFQLFVLLNFRSIK